MLYLCPTLFIFEMHASQGEQYLSYCSFLSTVSLEPKLLCAVSLDVNEGVQFFLTKLLQSK